MPSMTVIIQLPVATIVEIQRQGNGLDQTLQNLSLSPASPYRLVHDIARNVANAVNALPFTIASKDNAIKAIPIAGMSSFATLIGSPEDDVFAPRASIPAKLSRTPISVVIEEPSGKLESFSVSTGTTLHEVANMYHERTGIHVNDVTFDCAGGNVTYGSSLDSKTLYQVFWCLAKLEFGHS